ncbi:hypothetical protein SLNHY_6119 [Streptomyces albus]|nr:hypothetical protein SLNHY_6119 [Streptomyces albus]
MVVPDMYYLPEGPRRGGGAGEPHLRGRAPGRYCLPAAGLGESE